MKVICPLSYLLSQHSAILSEDRKAKGQVSGVDDELMAVIVAELGLALKGK